MVFYVLSFGDWNLGIHQCNFGGSSMPFTTDQFLGVFQQYNLSLWPIQVFLNLLGFIAVFLVFFRKAYSDRVISLILALLWLWTGIVYHLIYFSSINPAANVFGALVILQGLLFAYDGVIRNKMNFGYSSGYFSAIGAILIIYALFLYPAIGYLIGHVFPTAPTFGLPCPTTIFTFGMLLLTVGKLPLRLLVIPFLWSLLGFTAALSFGIYEDLGLLISGILTATLVLVRNRMAAAPQQAS